MGLLGAAFIAPVPLAVRKDASGFDADLPSRFWNFLAFASGPLSDLICIGFPRIKKSGYGAETNYLEHLTLVVPPATPGQCKLIWATRAALSSTKITSAEMSKAS